MDDGQFKEEMAKLRRFQSATDWTPPAALAIYFGALWLTGASLDPQGWAIVGAVGGVGLLVFREIRGLHAAIMLARVETARARRLGTEL